MLVEVEEIGGMRFVGGYVLMPADDIWCVVIEPRGIVVGGGNDEDRAEMMGKGLECSLWEDDRLGAVSAVVVCKASEVKNKKRREARTAEDYAVQLRKWGKERVLADAKLFKQANAQPQLSHL